MFNVLFICNGDEKTGFGHVSRCLNIASELFRLKSNLSIQFNGRYGDFACQAITKAGFICSSADPLALKYSISLVFVDDYHIQESTLQQIKEAGSAIAIIDDFNMFSWPCIDLIINFRFLAEKLYLGSEKHLLGLNYFPVKPSLVKLRLSRKKLQNGEGFIKNILIFISGSASFESGINIIFALDNVVHNKNIWWLTSTVKDMNLKNNTLTKIDYTNDMYNLYKDVDIVISGGGLSKYEAGFCMIPNATISQTEMQQQDTDILAKHRLCFDLGIAEDINQVKLQESLSQFFKIEVLNSQLNAFHNTYDSQSLNNVAVKILALISE